MPERCLVVNADDFGLSKAITQGTIQAIEQGLVNSVSIAANGNDLKDACHYLQLHPEISPGWHINLTTGKPVSDINTKRTLYNGKNNLALSLIMKQLDFQAVQNELEAQWQCLNDYSLKITHVDSHHDVHFWPGLRKVILDFIKDKDIQYVRYAGSRLYRKPVIRKPKYFAGYRILNRILCFFPVREMQDVNYIQFRELYQCPNKEKILNLYINQLKPGTTLWICHPGEFDTKNELNLAYNRHRQLETKALCSEVIKSKLKEYNITRTNFRELMDG